MELILICESKLKIMLSPDDMQKYELSCENVDYGNTETRRAFWSILDCAKQKTGFDAASERVYIQLYPSRDGGCEMYVTKLGSAGSERGEKKAEAPPRKKAKKEKLAYSFSKITDLLCVCRALSQRKAVCESRAYVCDNGKCMLFLALECKSEERNPLGFIEEFGSKTDHELAQAYANEHYRCICKENAVQTLARLA